MQKWFDAQRMFLDSSLSPMIILELQIQTLKFSQHRNYPRMRQERLKI